MNKNANVEIYIGKFKSMKNYMKTSVIKKIVVKCGKFWMDEIEIDSNIFDDVYLEAATRAVEKRKDLSDFKVTIIAECWEKRDFKKPDKHFCYNMYHIFVNAGLHKKAEALRLNFMRMNGYDLQKQSLKGDNGTTATYTAPRTQQSGSTEY